MASFRKLIQVVAILAGCLAICFALISLIVAGLFANGVIEQNAALSLSTNLALIAGGLAAMLGAKKWLS